VLEQVPPGHHVRGLIAHRLSAAAVCDRALLLRDALLPELPKKRIGIDLVLD
jgi:hypothetical protein